METYVQEHDAIALADRSPVARATVEPSMPFRRKTVWTSELGDELNRIYRTAADPDTIDLRDGVPATTTTMVSFSPGSNSGPIIEFDYKAQHSPVEQDAIIELAISIADLHTPSGETEVIARHLNFWSDWAPGGGRPHVGLHITYWVYLTQEDERD